MIQEKRLIINYPTNVSTRAQHYTIQYNTIENENNMQNQMYSIKMLQTQYTRINIPQKEIIPAWK